MKKTTLFWVVFLFETQLHMEKVLEIVNLTKKYKNLTAVDNLNLSVEKGNIYGLESSLDGKWGKWTHTHNLSLFTSLYETSEHSYSAGRFDQRVLIHNYIGREWSKQGTKSKRLVGIFTGVHYGGSLRDSPIPLTNNAVPYSITRPDQFRLDFRVYRRKFYNTVNTLLALDIQNLTNQQNFSYSYFDNVMNKINLQYQLGVLPNLSYTIEF